MGYVVYCFIRGSCNGGHIVSRHESGVKAKLEAARNNLENKSIQGAIYVACQECNDGFIEVGAATPIVRKCWGNTWSCLARVKSVEVAERILASADYIPQYKAEAM